MSATSPSQQQADVASRLETNSNPIRERRLTQLSRESYHCRQQLRPSLWLQLLVAVKLILLCTYKPMISSMSTTTTLAAPTIGPTMTHNVDSSPALVEDFDSDPSPLVPLTQHQPERPAAGDYSSVVSSDERSPETETKHMVAEEETSTGSVVEYVDNNQILSGSMEVMESDNKLDDASNSFLNSLGSKGSSPVKNRRHAAYQIKSADWWTKVSKPNQQLYPESTKTNKTTSGQSGAKRPPPTNKRPLKVNQAGRKGGSSPAKSKAFVYREQPLKQNQIITLKYQLKSIRRMQKALVDRPVNQLQRLDDRLVESYRLCLKKKMPLYAGMLYRTRDFVIRMAKDIKHERRVLDAMAKQVEVVLRDRMTNKTLVKEYNRITDPIAMAMELSRVDIQTSTETTSSKIVIPRVRKNIQQQHSKTPGADVTTQKSILAETETRPTFNQESLGAKGGSKPSQAKRPNKTNVSKGCGATKSVADKIICSGARDEMTTRKPKQVTRYKVNVNEVNLKKELMKTQQLIDRINVSCHDLTGVIDDIIYLFKLTSDSDPRKGGEPNKMDKFLNQIASSQSSDGFMDQKQAKKMLRSPIGIFFERYGKLTMDPAMSSVGANGQNSGSTTVMAANASVSTTTAHSVITMTTSPPELRPLFEPSSLIYTEPKDLELGFDAPIDPDSSF